MWENEALPRPRHGDFRGRTATQARAQPGTDRRADSECRHPRRTRGVTTRESLAFMRLLGLQKGGWLPNRALARRLRGPLLGGVWLHCHTRWRANILDAALAAGVDPMQSDELSLRVGQLRAARSRARVAGVLRGAGRVSGKAVRPAPRAASRHAARDPRKSHIAAGACRTHCRRRSSRRRGPRSQFPVGARSRQPAQLRVRQPFARH